MSGKHTVAKWLTMIGDEKIRNQLIDNIPYDCWNNEYHNFPMVLSYTFDWDKSPEGAKYWLDVYEKTSINSEYYMMPKRDLQFKIIKRGGRNAIVH